MKIPIFLDMDEIITQFLNKLCLEYNNKYNKNLKPSDIKSYSLLQYIGEEGCKIFNTPGFFSSLKPIKDSIQTIEKLLNDNNEVFIITSPMMNKYSIVEKFLWIKEYLPFFPIKNLILVGNKGDLLEKLNGGILFDDCPLYIKKFNGITVVMDREYNQDVECDYRVNNWDEFYKIVKEINL